MSKSTLEGDLLWQLKACGLPEPQREYHFHPERRWRFDLAWPAHRVAVEVDGGIHTGGRHVRGSGFEQDCHKLNTAALLDWTVIRCTAGMLRDGSALLYIEAALSRFCAAAD